jgi:hypothetical protein
VFSLADDDMVAGFFFFDLLPLERLGTGAATGATCRAALATGGSVEASAKEVGMSFVMIMIQR